MLGGTKGTLVVEMYTGYNIVTGVDGRERAGCLAHARRKFFNALPYAPEFQTALDLIREIYLVEHDVHATNLSDDAHAKLRWEKVLPFMDKLYVWLAQQRERHPPKSQPAIAVRYAMRNWQALTRFIRDTKIPPDNNRSEAALRVRSQPNKALSELRART